MRTFVTRMWTRDCSNLRLHKLTILADKVPNWDSLSLLHSSEPTFLCLQQAISCRYLQIAAPETSSIRLRCYEPGRVGHRRRQLSLSSHISSGHDAARSVASLRPWRISLNCKVRPQGARKTAAEQRSTRKGAPERESS